MISKQELSKVKELRKTNLYYTEKEYLQYIFLNAIAKYSHNFIFKGGTCLRICYGLERASEDLDFNAYIGAAKTKEIVNQCLKNFELLNIPYKIYSEKEYQGNLRIEIRFEGPLFRGNPESTNTLKIDFNKGKVSYTKAKVIGKLFSDVPLFTLLVLDEREILAEKTRALFNRGESRDLYDVWILLNKDVLIDKKLLLQKLKEEKPKNARLLLPTKQEYEQDLKTLVDVLPPYDQVVKEVMAKINKLNIK